MNRTLGSKHAWLIGASHGMGRELALQLANEGWTLTLSARGEDALRETAAECAASALAFDATDREAVKLAAHQAYTQTPPDLVLLNVGDYRPMALADFDVELFERLNSTNYLAAVYLIDALLPLLDGRQTQLVLNASASAYCGLPQAAPYSAPKAALLNLAESLQPELARAGVDLRVINPGFVESRLTKLNKFSMPFLLTAEQAGKRIAQGLKGRGFEIAFPRRLIWSLKLLRLLPYRAYFALTGRMAKQ